MLVLLLVLVVVVVVVVLCWCLPRELLPPPHRAVRDSRQPGIQRWRQQPAHPALPC